MAQDSKTTIIYLAKYSEGLATLRADHKKSSCFYFIFLLILPTLFFSLYCSRNHIDLSIIMFLLVMSTIILLYLLILNSNKIKTIESNMYGVDLKLKRQIQFGIGLLDHSTLLPEQEATLRDEIDRAESVRASFKDIKDQKSYRKTFNIIMNTISTIILAFITNFIYENYIREFIEILKG